MSTHGQFTLHDNEQSVTLYTFHDGNAPEAISELFSIMDWAVQKSAKVARALYEGNPNREEINRRAVSGEWINLRESAPGWCLILCNVHRSKSELQHILDQPDFEENIENSGLGHDPCDAMGIAHLMVARHFNRWFPYPEDYRSFPGDDFSATIKNIGDGMDQELRMELAEPFKDLLEKIPCVRYENGRATLNFRRQFFHALRRELAGLMEILPD